MFVLHGTWQGDRLCVWAEDSTLPAATRNRTSVRPHPYAAPAAELVSILAGLDAGLGESAIKATEDDLILLLPGSASAPQSSPELGRNPTRPRLRRWRLPALSFDPATALELLAAIDSVSTDEVLVGADLRYWTVVAADAVDTVRRGRLLPTLVTEEDRYAARWRPVLAGALAVRFRQLAEAMPPVCRAGRAEPVAAHVLLEALATLVDTEARRRMPAITLPGRRGRPSFTERWLRALTSTDGRFGSADEPGQAVELSAALRDWFSAAHRTTGAATVCFQLTEPGADSPSVTDDPADRYHHEENDENDDSWRIRFALQSVEDPSLIVSARDLWAGENLPGLAARPDDTLLAGLARASRLYPALDDALAVARPCELTVDTAGAHTFLSEVAPSLRAAGFGVRLPAWAGRSRLGLKLTTRSTPSDSDPATPSRFGLEQLVRFRWDIALGEETISAEELAELARLKVPLVRVRGRWVELDDRQLKAALHFLATGGPTGMMTAGEVIDQAVRGGPEELPLVEVDADGRLGDLLSGQADRRLEPRSTPEGFQGTLRPYQQRGLSWLAFLGELGLGALLADDMGLGKTPQTLALLAAERSDPDGPDQVGPTLVVCPMSLVGTWQREAARFTPQLRVYVHHGTDRHVGAELAAAVEQADLVVTTYATLARDRSDLATVEWGRVVCDEAQAIKNSATQQARAVRAMPAGSRIALTGTPVENHLGELWSIMDFANPGLLGPKAEFHRRYAVPIERDGDQGATAALRRATQPFVLRRLKTDRSIISDLPDKLEMKVYCNLTPEQASLYQATVDDMLDRIAHSDGIERRGLVLATMAKLKQVCNHPAHLLKDGSRLVGRSGKLARLEEICQELLAEGDRALCFTQYAEFGALLQPYLTARLGRPVLWLHGGTSRSARDAMVERFQTDDQPMVFLLSLKAAGTGLTLTAANHVIHFDRWWNPAVEDQATDRAFRIGQTQNVQVRTFVCVGTLEERIDQMLESKKALAEQIVGNGEEWLTELSVAELRDVIRLAPEAVTP